MKRLFTVIILTGFFYLFADGIQVLGNIDKSFEIIEKGYISWYLEEQGISAEALLIVGDNGTSAYIESSAIEKVEIVPGKDGWEVFAEMLPAVCSIRNIQEIWVYQGFWNVELKICNETGESKTFTPFSWNLQKYNKNAESEKNGYMAKKYLPSEQNFAFPKNAVVITFADKKIEETEFNEELFGFDGIKFYYDGRSVSKIECE